MKLYCFDPGKTTGFAIFDITEGNAVLSYAAQSREVIGFLQKMEEHAHVVYEGFARGNAASYDQIATITLIGSIRSYCISKGIKYTMQYPASRKGFILPAKAMVRELLHGTEKTYHHSIDAIAHGLSYCEKEEINWEKQYWLGRISSIRGYSSKVK